MKIAAASGKGRTGKTTFSTNLASLSAEEKAEMIILGSHEHGIFYHLLMGSTHNLLIKKSEIPILIIPPHIK